jgi:CHAT domain-containing protein/Tfp pilus assembly protein PilF
LLTACIAAVSALEPGCDASEATRLSHQPREVAEQGNYVEAAPLPDRALALREQAQRPDSAEAAAADHDLAEIYREMGAYAKALPLARRALHLREILLGADHPDTAESLNDLGVLHMDMGDYAQALPLYERALRIRTQRFGPLHPATAETLNNLAAAHWSLKQYAQAEPLFERALAIREETLGRDDPQTATSLNNLAELYRSMGQPAKAVPLLERAATIWEKALGPHDPRVATALSNLAMFHWAAGEPRRALPLLERAAAICDESLGAAHPDTVRSRNLLAALNQNLGRYAEALALYRRALVAEEANLANLFAFTSETQKLQLLKKSQGHYFAALSLIRRRFPSDPAAVRFGLELVLRRKGIVLDAQSRTQEVLAKQLTGENLHLWQRLVQHRSDFAKLLFAGPGNQSLQDYRQRVTALQTSIAADEQMLGDRGSFLPELAAPCHVTADEVAKHLPFGSALVEFVLVPDWDERRLAWSSSSRYLGFTLTSENRVSLTDFGDAGAIDAQIRGLLQAIREPQFFKDFVGYTSRTDAELTRAYEVLLKPLEAAMGATGALIVSPDGELNKVPFAALRRANRHYLIEDRMLSYVASGRDLLRARVAPVPTVSLFLVADPAFDDPRAESSQFRTRPLSGGPYFPRLPGTLKEAELIAPLVSGTKTILLGPQATEGAVRAVQSPRILHLATHGFFLENVDKPILDIMSSGQGSSSTPDVSAMVRSGLALAGANNARSVTSGDDGILTALEVTGMNLHGTDLVVLSACDTALGDIKAGEGVYGLRRAFVLAGAKNVVMTLWAVDDKTTRSLMERFYRAYAGGQAAAPALRRAQLETVAALRDTFQHRSESLPLAPVNLWAAFMVQQTAD